MSYSPSEQFSNFARALLNADIDNAVTVLTVSDAGPFPVLPFFRLKIGAELMVVSGVSGADFTVSRGAEGTTAAAHTAGDAVTGVVTVGALQGLRFDTIQLAREACGIFRGLTFSNGQLTVDYNAGTGRVWSDLGNHGLLRLSPSSGSDLSGRGVSCTAPFIATFAIRGFAWAMGSGVSIGVLVWDSTSGSGTACELLTTDQTANPDKWGIFRFNAFNSFNSVALSAQQAFLAHQDLLWIQVEDDSTNRTWRVSTNGLEWVDLYQTASATFLTADHVGVVAAGNAPNSVDTVIEVVSFDLV